MQSLSDISCQSRIKLWATNWIKSQLFVYLSVGFHCFCKWASGGNDTRAAGFAHHSGSYRCRGTG